MASSSAVYPHVSHLVVWSEPFLLFSDPIICAISTVATNLE